MANAPHIPVHLGAMQEAVQWQLNHLQGDLHEGDVLLSNHPAAGGSHLPDLTVITPVSLCACVCVCVCHYITTQVFYPGCEKPVFFVASRGHHADIGGITPGTCTLPPSHLHALTPAHPHRFHAATLQAPVGGRNECEKFQAR